MSCQRSRHRKDFLIIKSLKRKWLTHILVLPSLLQVHWTLRLVWTLYAFYLFQDSVCSSISSPWNCFLLCLYNSCLDVLLRGHGLQEAFPGHHPQWIRCSQRLLYTYLIVLYMPVYLSLAPVYSALTICQVDSVLILISYTGTFVAVGLGRKTGLPHYHTTVTL